MDVSDRPIFFPIVPDRNPRTECGCQPVAFISSFKVAPPDRFSKSRTLAALLPWRAPSADFANFALFGFLVPFWAEVGIFPDLALPGATRGFRGAALGVLVASGARGRGGLEGLFFNIRRRHRKFSLRGDYRGQDIDHSVRPRKQANSAAMAMERR